MAYEFDVDDARSRTMSRIRSQDTKVEVALRRALWARGIRYRKNYRKVVGSPDIALVGRKVAIFVDGDFWHGYDWDNRKERIKSNATYWIPKIERTIHRDRATNLALQQAGWIVIRFWDFEVRRDPEACAVRVADTLANR